MKKYSSVFEMIVRSSIYKVLFLLGIMVITEAVCFSLSMISPSGVNIEEYINQSLFSTIFQIAYLLVTAVLVFYGMNMGSMQSYTLQRLRIREKNIFWLQALYNALAYVLLWGVQLVMILISASVYYKNLPEGHIHTNQTLFIAFYRSEFMHSILPLEDAPGWWVLILILVSSAFTTAVFTKLQRIGKFGFELFILVGAVLVSFPRAVGEEFVFLVIAIVTVGVVMGMRKLLE